MSQGPLPVLPLKNTVVYPQLVVPLAVGRPRSTAALNAALAQTEDEKRFICVSQRNPEDENPDRAGLADIGTLVVVRRVDRGDNGAQIAVQGLARVRLRESTQDEPYLCVNYELLPTLPMSLAANALSDEAHAPTAPELRAEYSEADAYARENLVLGRSIAELIDPGNGLKVFRQLIESLQDPLMQAYRMASLANLDLARQQHVLEADSARDVQQRLHEILQHELAVAQLRKEIAGKANSDVEKAQRDQMLRQQKRAIEQALGDDAQPESDAAEMRRRFRDAKLPEAVRTEAERECRRLERMSPNAADYQMVRAYLELVIELPWTDVTEDNLDLARAHNILDEDHFGLEDVKERILEFLAVMALNPKAKAPILCFVGPPGVGKTSLGQSIARAIGRKFERLSLGGMHDEAELRGHRRTYVGAMPGRILQALRRAKVANPMLMLDEIDKLGRDFRGDPAAALMEILDPAQNSEFRDNYLNMAFDLSKVLFVTTANSLETIPRPLLDRMEVLQLSGYSQSEKEQIARRYLLPRQQQDAGLTPEQLNIDAPALSAVIARYTREAGVRTLERTIGRIARKQARKLLEGKPVLPIDISSLPELLGPERFFPEKARKTLRPGVAAGLAWTEAGGDVLYVEATTTPREEKLTLTGQLGDVMQESVKAARSWLWSASSSLGIEPSRMTDTGVHVHVPAGAVPKDGPSAGVTMATALASLYLDRAVRSDLAMTGEITLSGLVLPVGGIKEKVLAAHRAGMRVIVLPRENEHDLDKLPEHVRADLKFVLVDRIDEVLAEALSSE